MYYLVDKELEEFIKRYFPMWGKDILTVSYRKYKDKTIYLINHHYTFVI